MRNILERDAAWCWFQDPRSIYFQGKTYFSWVKQNGDVGVCALGPSGYATGTLKAALQYDDHAAPALLGMPDGKVAAFYSAHGGSKMYYRKTVSVGGVSSWGTEQYLPFGAPTEPNSYGYTYANPIYLSGEGGGKTYLFFRWNGQDPHLTTNIDDTLPDFKWTTARKIFKSGFRPYMKVCSDGNTRIWFAVTDGHPLNVTVNNIYAFYYEAGNWKNPDGTQIKTSTQLETSPIQPSQLNASAKVYDANTSGLKSWVWDIALDSNGKPVITYASFPTQTDHRYNRATYDTTNNVFVSEEIAQGGSSFEESGNEPWYSGGIVLDHSDTDILYTSEQVDTTRWDIKKYTKNGSSWDSETFTSFGKNVRPLVPRDHSNVEVAWMNGDYAAFTAFNTGYLGV